MFHMLNTSPLTEMLIPTDVGVPDILLNGGRLDADEETSVELEAAVLEELNCLRNISGVGSGAAGEDGTTAMSGVGRA